jgi:hypothetical protein
METRAFPVSVKGVAVQGGKVLLLRNERDEWELPGGGHRWRNKRNSAFSSIITIADFALRQVRRRPRLFNVVDPGYAVDRGGNRPPNQP